MIAKKTLWKSLPVVALVLAGGRAHAQDCTLGPNAIVLSGSSAMGPTVKATAGPLLATGNVDVYYYAPGSCTGTNAFLNGDDLVGKSADHYDAMGTKSTCTLPAGTKADLGVSDVFVEVCTGGTKPAGVTDFPGFIQSMLYVVPRQGNTQTALVAEEGYFVFGAGTTGYMGMTISPWVDQTKFAIRNAGSGTQQMIARSIKLTAEAMKGTDSGGTGGVVTALTMAGTSPTTAEPAIGIMSSDAYDVQRMNLKSLAFQAFKQNHAYFADSTNNTFDKQNVRDGHYTIWGPLHMVAKTGADGKATKAQVQDFIDYVQLKKPLGTTKFIDVIIGAHVVPSCAMKVQRSTEMGDLSPYTPAAGTACGCYFDEKIKGAGMSGCTACPMGNECTGGKTCSNGFCE
jgi:ABC-type phosphate transport system substrate-binding protein